MNFSLLMQQYITALPIPLIFFLGGIAILSKVQSCTYTKKTKILGFLFVWISTVPLGLLIHFSRPNQDDINNTLITTGFVISLLVLIAIAFVGEKTVDDKQHQNNK